MKIKIFFLIIFFVFNCYPKDKTVLLFTGLPCSGKTTLSKALHEALPNSVIFDADEVRSTINKDLGFSKKDREENLRRVSQMAILASKSSDLVILCFISPYDSIRKYMRGEIEKEKIKFLEIFVQASVKECIRRDVKGMYKKALEGKIKNFTGISAPYENPKSPDLICNTEKKSVEKCLDDVISLIEIPHPQKPHAAFIGRWSPFHKGHWKIMKKVYEEDKNRPLLIFVRNRKNEYWSAQKRKRMVEVALKKMKVPGKVMIIPDIDSVNWGRGVGYATRMIDVDASTKAISGTKIREMISKKDESWRSFLCPGVAEIILAEENSKMQ